MSIKIAWFYFAKKIEDKNVAKKTDSHITKEEG
jgi:hypothetical protein